MTTASTEPRTIYHDSITAFRRDLVASSRMFEQLRQPHSEVTHGWLDAVRGLPEGEGPPRPEADIAAHSGCLMAGSYAYTLAAVLGAAQHMFGNGVAQELACIADDILTNGDDRDRNADAMPADPAHPDTHDPQPALD